MLAFAVLTVACQWLEAKPSHTEVGVEVRIEAREEDGEPIAGLALEARMPDGSVESIGATDADGDFAFVPEAVGAHRISASYGGAVLISPLHAEARAPRLWYALVCVPLGLALLWRHSRRARD